MKAEWTNRDSLSIEETTGQNSKAILVIDMPTSCYECQFQGMAGRDLELSTCSLNYCCVDNPNERPSWCPLKPLPKWKNEYTDIDAMGWNACLDEITGETE